MMLSFYILHVPVGTILITLKELFSSCCDMAVELAVNLRIE